jgi:putative ABC transport system permease protein
MYAFKTLLNQYLRFIITVFGIALCIILMLFLLAVYKGAADGAIQYIRSNDADIWVMQNNATNILRNTSLIPAGMGKTLSGIEGVKSVSPVLFLLASVKTSDHPASIYLAGYDLQSVKGRPPSIIKGRNIEKDNEIVLDNSFASKFRIRIGSQVIIKKDTLTVTGFSTGTNLFVLQYAFITLKKAKEMLGFPGYVSSYLIETSKATGTSQVVKSIVDAIPGIAVYNNLTFLENNSYEMKSGVLPLLFIVAFIGGIILTAILSLILSVYVLEQRQDYAIMKAIGSPSGFISLMVVEQALMLAGSGMLLAFILFFPLLKLVERISPEVTAESSVLQIVVVSVSLVVISLISSVIPMLKLRRIYPLEVFY